MIYRLYQSGNQITTRSNRDNVYMSLKNAKVALRNYLSWVNKKIHDKNLQVKADSCQIIGFDLVEKVRHTL